MESHQNEQEERQRQLEEVVKFAIFKCRENNNPLTEAIATFVS